MDEDFFGVLLHVHRGGSKNKTRSSCLMNVRIIDIAQVQNEDGESQIRQRTIICLGFLNFYGSGHSRFRLPTTVEPP